jgi:hypothetical protein
MNDSSGKCYCPLVTHLFLCPARLLRDHLRDALRRRHLYSYLLSLFTILLRAIDAQRAQTTTKLLGRTGA